MSIIRPPVTGDIQLDSWMNQVNNALAYSQGSPVQVAIEGDTSGSTGGSTGDVVNAVTLILYKAYSSSTLPPEEDLQVVTQYTYATGVFENAVSTEDLNGWSRILPASDKFIYAIQVNIADTAEIETIPANAWSTPIRVYSNATDRIDVRIATNNGTALRFGGATTTLKAVVSREGNDESDIAHNGYYYEWSVPSGEIVCVDASRNVINDGKGPLLATGTVGALFCTTGTPASSTEANDIHGSTLREITIGSEDIDKSQPIQLQVSNIPD